MPFSQVPPTGADGGQRGPDGDRAGSFLGGSGKNPLVRSMYSA